MIANSKPEVYDIFSHVCQPGTYIPNQRGREFIRLQPADNLVNAACMKLMESWREYDSFRDIVEGSETIVVDPNLQLVLNIIQNLVRYPNNILSVETFSHPSASNYLQKSMASKHCYTYEFDSRDYVVVGCEAKGLESSIRKCYSQLISLCGSSAIDMVQRGIRIEDAVVPPGIATAAGGFQICLVYLLKPCFPVIVAVTNLLNPLGSFEDQKELSRWLLRCYMFGVETVNIICRERVNPPSYRGAYLDTSIYFFKPIRETLKVTEFPTDNVLYLTTLSSTVNHIMLIYQVLYSSDCIENGINLFLFPSGVITGFGDGSGYEDFKVAFTIHIASKIKFMCC